MLILTRRQNEEILINQGEITIKVLYFRNGLVALGIKAPTHMDVDRPEVFIKKQLNGLAKKSSATTH